MFHVSLPRAFALTLVGAFLLGACSYLPTPVPNTPEDYNTGRPNTMGRLTGEEGLTIGGTRKKPAEDGVGAGIGVNAYLWRATLDTLAFMPLASADPFGGVVITEWYSPPATPNERFKMNVYILGRQLRADGLKVTVFRQMRSATGWQDAPTSAQLGVDIENKVLTRARQLRLASVQG